MLKRSIHGEHVISFNSIAIGLSFLVIHAKHRPRPPICDIKIVVVRVVPTESARNIGVMFKDVMNHEHQVQNIC